MKKCFIIMLISLLSSFTQSSFGSDNPKGLAFFTLKEDADYGGADLIELGWGTKKDPKHYNGTVTNAFGMKIINVYIQKDEFEKQYDFCTLIGMGMPNNANEPYCQFGYNDNKYFFQATGNASCSFMCKEIVKGKNKK